VRKREATFGYTDKFSTRVVSLATQQARGEKRTSEVQRYACSPLSTSRAFV